MGISPNSSSEQKRAVQQHPIDNYELDLHAVRQDAGEHLAGDHVHLHIHPRDTTAS